MSDNLDFMAIFGGEGSLDLGSGGEDFDALFAEKEPATQPPGRKSPENHRRNHPTGRSSCRSAGVGRKEGGCQCARRKSSRSPDPTGSCPGKEACGSQSGSQAACCARKSL